MSHNNTSIFNVILGAVGLLGIGYGIAMHTKLAKVSERLDQSIDSLADDMEIDIPEELVQKAIDKAIALETKRAAEKAANEAVAEVRRDIRRDVNTAVDREYDRIKETVLKEITGSASKIDVARVTREVEAAAKKAALEKFDANLEGILEKFNADLDNTAKVYSTIKSMMTPASPSKEYVFRVG